jgi:twinkle protein
LCEGELDAITWHQYGYESVMALSGANSFKNEWMDILDKYKKIYLNLDQDPVGNAAKEKLIKRIGTHRCKIIKTPFKDINECLMKGFTKKEIDGI